MELLSPAPSLSPPSCLVTCIWPRRLIFPAGKPPTARAPSCVSVCVPTGPRHYEIRRHRSAMAARHRTCLLAAAAACSGEATRLPAPAWMSATPTLVLAPYCVCLLAERCGIAMAPCVPRFPVPLPQPRHRPRAAANASACLCSTALPAASPLDNPHTRA